MTLRRCCVPPPCAVSQLATDGRGRDSPQSATRNPPSLIDMSLPRLLRPGTRDLATQYALVHRRDPELEARFPTRSELDRRIRERTRLTTSRAPRMKGQRLGASGMTRLCLPGEA